MMNSLPAYAAALCAVALGLAVLIQKHRSLASWQFLSGMVVLGLESAVGGLRMRRLAKNRGLVFQNIFFKEDREDHTWTW